MPHFMLASRLSPTPTSNQLLAALPPGERARWSEHMELVVLKLGQVLYEPGAPQSHVYFPTTAMVSLLHAMEDRSSAQSAVVGRDGMVGVCLFMGGETTTGRAVVYCAGESYRMPAAAAKAEFSRHGEGMHLMLRYTQALITQKAQTAVCNRHHQIEQQLCRWFLLNLDRIAGEDLLMTQQLIASMLGVRREGVTEAALKLQRLGLIGYARGRISVIDRIGLERLSCECYGVVKREYDRLLDRGQ